MESFSGKNAVVIGGSGGIGKALCTALVATGANIVVHGGHDSDAFTDFISQLQTAALQTERGCGSITKLVLPITVENFSTSCATILQPVLQNADIVCVCFGPFVQKTLEQTTISDWQFVSLCDYALPGVCISSALPHMVHKHWGRFLLFGGTRTYMLNGFSTNAAYGGAKSGVCSLVRSVAWNYAQQGITCNALLPGFVDTEYIDESVKKELRTKTPSGTLITPEVIAEEGLHLLQNEKLNGVLLNVDDGWIP